MTSLITPRVFISYARSDGEEFAHTLRERLKKEGIPLWQDRAGMEGGRDWWLQITEALDQVEFMVLVMTPSALSSEMVRKEWRYARQQGVCVYPVKANPDLDFSLLPRWMSSAHFYDLEHEWTKFVNDLNTRCQQPRIPFMVEDLPEDFVPRQVEFDALLSLLLDRKREEPIAITAALKGAGGYGKTTLARALCHNEDIQNSFDDGILWVTLGEKSGDLIGKLEDLIYLLGKERPGFKSVEAATTRLSELLANRDILMVIDDVWNAAHLKPFLQGGPRCARLVTTRMVDTLPKSAQRVDVDAMSRDEAVQLLSAGIVTNTSDQASLEVLARRLGEWPTLLKLVNGALRERVNNQGQTLPEALEYVNKALDRKGLTFFDARNAEDRHQAVAKTICVSLELLSPEENVRFSELAVFPEDVDIPLATLEALWGKTGELDEFDVEALCDRLFHLSLLLHFNPTTRQIRLHDVIRLYLIEQHKKDIPELHETLLSLYRPATGWSSLSSKEPYLWDHLAYHLAEAGNDEELRLLFSDDRWLHARVTQSGYIYSGYLADLAIEWEIADGKVAEDEAYLADCFRCGLIRTSINSLAGNYVPELVVAAVETDLWSLERAISVAERIPSIDQACKLYTLLLEMDNFKETQIKTLQIKGVNAALAVEGLLERAKALSAVAKQLKDEEKSILLQQAFEAACAESYPFYKAEALTTVAEQLKGEEKDKAVLESLNAALSIEDEWSQACALAALSKHLIGEQNTSTLHKALDAALAIKDDAFRAHALTAVAGQLSGEQNSSALRKALNAAIAIRYRPGRAMALAVVAGQLSGQMKTKTLKQALATANPVNYDKWESEALVAVAQQLSGHKKARTLQLALKAACAETCPKVRAETLVAVARQLSGEQKTKALQWALDAVGAESDAQDQVEALAAVTIQLSDEDIAPVLQQILEIALSAKDEFWQAEALATVVKRLNDEQKARVIARAMETSQTIRDEWAQVWLLTAVTQHFSGDSKVIALQRALDSACSIYWSEMDRVKALTIVANQLTGIENIPALLQALDAARTIGDQKMRTEALLAVAQQLSGQQKTEALQLALDAARAVSDDRERVAALVAVSQYLNGQKKTKTLQLVLKTARTIRDNSDRTEALLAVSSQFIGHQKVETLQWALESARAVSDVGDRAMVLANVAGQLDSVEKTMTFQQALKFASAVKDEWQRAYALAAVAQQLSGEENATVLQKALDAVLVIKDEFSRAYALLAVARQLNGKQNSSALWKALNAAHDIKNKQLQVKALTSVAGQLSGEQKTKTLQQAIEVTHAIEIEETRSNALVALAQHLCCEQNTSVIQQSFDAILSIKSEKLRAATKVAFLVHLDKTSAMRQVIECLHLMGNQRRFDYLVICYDLLPKLELQPKTYETIADHLIKICSTWKWL